MKTELVESDNHLENEMNDNKLREALMLCEWISETPHNRGSINGKAAQLAYSIREALAAGKPEPQAQEEPCPDFSMGEHACKNRHQCWEPCGELGKSEAHVNVHVSQAQAGEPNVFGYAQVAGALTQWSKQKPAEKDQWATVELITLQSHREAIAKKNAALKACVEALEEAEVMLHKLQVFAASKGALYQDLRMDEESVFRKAITKVQESLK